MRRRTLRGQVVEGTTKRLILDDGRLNHGFKVVRFVVAADPSVSTNDCWATLSLDFDSPLVWDWGDNRQIGWASSTVATNAHQEGFELIDPDHVVIMDLWIQGQVSGGGGTSVFNYLVEIEPVELSNDESILSLIKERSQDDLR